ncbi:MAG: hypothetical protein ACP5UV_05215 [Thermoplasmata archaeon]
MSEYQVLIIEVDFILGLYLGLLMRTPVSDLMIPALFWWPIFLDPLLRF